MVLVELIRRLGIDGNGSNGSNRSDVCNLVLTPCEGVTVQELCRTSSLRICDETERMMIGYRRWKLWAS